MTKFCYVRSGNDNSLLTKEQSKDKFQLNGGGNIGTMASVPTHNASQNNIGWEMTRHL